MKKKPAGHSPEDLQMTPMVRQYYKLKDSSQGAILFFRMGDFYEIFGDDATQVAPLLDLTLTSRERGDQERLPFCGVPHHSAKNYWLRLLRLGFKVALADQVEDPATAKGLVRREIVKYFTPGCIDDLDGLEEDSPNYLMGIYEPPGKDIYAIALFEVSTGEIRLGNVACSDLAATVARWKPKELLARRFFHGQLTTLLQEYRQQRAILLGELPEAALRDDTSQRDLLTEILGKPSVETQPCGSVVGGDALAAGIFSYLRSLHANTKQFLTIKPLSDGGTLSLGDSVLRDLEIFETAHQRRKEGSLFYTINQTLSPMGARLLRFHLANLLLDPNAIQSRTNAVNALIQCGSNRLAEARANLTKISDLERLTTRLSAGTITPAEIGRIRATLKQTSELGTWIETLPLEEVLQVNAHEIDKHRSNTIKQDCLSQFRQLSTDFSRCLKAQTLLQTAVVEVPGHLGVA